MIYIYVGSRKEQALRLEVNWGETVAERLQTCRSGLRCLLSTDKPVSHAEVRNGVLQYLGVIHREKYYFREIIIFVGAALGAAHFLYQAEHRTELAGKKLGKKRFCTIVFSLYPIVS